MLNDLIKNYFNHLKNLNEYGINCDMYKITETLDKPSKKLTTNCLFVGDHFISTIR